MFHSAILKVLCHPHIDNVNIRTSISPHPGRLMRENMLRGKINLKKKIKTN